MGLRGAGQTPRTSNATGKLIHEINISVGVILANLSLIIYYELGINMQVCNVYYKWGKGLVINVFVYVEKALILVVSVKEKLIS